MASRYYVLIAILLLSVSVERADADATATSLTETDLIHQYRPRHPSSERGRDGWVLLRYQVNADGSVGEVGVSYSSGRPGFIESAIDAAKHWQFDAGEAREMTTLINYAFVRWQPRMSHEFFRSNSEVHKLVDEGDLVAAELKIAELRQSDELNAFEFSNTLIAEGRVAGEQGNKERQLERFRLAAIGDGRWMEREAYLKLMRGIIVLELQLGDFASAVRDYDSLAETGPGRKAVEGLEETIAKVQAMLAENPDQNREPWRAADFMITVERQANIRDRGSEIENGFPNLGTADEDPELRN